MNLSKKIIQFEDLIDILVGDDDYDIGTVLAQYYCKCKYNKEILNLFNKQRFSRKAN